jgi:hypothetical protein
MGPAFAGTTEGIFMRFLYRRHPSRLENLCDRWHLRPGKRDSRIFGCAVHVAQEHPMLDFVMLALALGFFVAGIGYAYACERL